MRSKMVASKIRKAREAHGWSQQQLADRAGVHRNTIASAENGHTGIRLDTLRLLAEAFGVEALYFFKEGGC